MKNLILSVLLVCGLASCGETANEVDINWHGNPSFVYTYSNGKPNSWTWKQTFSVDSETAVNMEITARCRDDKESGEMLIEPGVTYKLSVSGGCKDKETSSVHLDSPNFESIQIISSDYILTIWSVKIKEE